MTNFYREVQHRAQCGKHALNAVLHFVTRGEWSQLITDRDLCQMMARLPLDTYHRVLQDFFPEVECRYGENVGAALKSAAATTSSASDNTNRSGGGGGRGGVELQNLDWVILLINGHYLAFVQADGPLFTVKGRNSESSKVTVKPAALAGPSLHPAVQRMATLNKSYGAGGSGGGFVSSSASTNVSASSPCTVSVATASSTAAGRGVKDEDSRSGPASPSTSSTRGREAAGGTSAARNKNKNPWWVNLDSMAPSKYPGQPDTKELLTLKGEDQWVLVEEQLLRESATSDADRHTPALGGSVIGIGSNGTGATAAFSGGSQKRHAAAGSSSADINGRAALGVGVLGTEGPRSKGSPASPAVLVSPPIGGTSTSTSDHRSTAQRTAKQEKGGVYVFFDPTCSFPKNAASGLRTCLVHVDRNPYRKICDTAKRSVSPHHREGERYAAAVGELSEKIAVREDRSDPRRLSACSGSFVEGGADGGNPAFAFRTKGCAGEAGGAVVPPGSTKPPAGAPEQTPAAAAAVAKTVRTPTGEPVGVEAVRGREVAARPKSGLLNGTVRTQAAYNQLMSKAPDKPRIPFR